MLSVEHGPGHSQSGRECDDGARITLDGVGLGKGKGKIRPPVAVYFLSMVAELVGQR